MQTLNRTQETNHRQDRLLLRHYVEQGSQEAFAALVARHLKLVYATCRRELGDAGLAEDVTQAVFLILAKKAPSLRSETHIAGWLFQTARFAAKNARTREQRRKQYEQQAAQIMATDETVRNDALWNSLEPVLNDALAHLPAADREAILLRYWNDHSLTEIGTALGVSEDAARKRVARAVDKLRMRLETQGVLVPGAALAALLPLHAANAVPASLTASGIAQMATGAVAGHGGAGLAAPSVHQLSAGVSQAMKIAQIKMAGFAAATIMIGLTGYAIAQRVAPPDIDVPTPVFSQPSNEVPAQVVGQPTPSSTTLTPQQITQQSQKAYDALRSYEVTVSVKDEATVGTSTAANVHDRTSAKILFTRPGKIRLVAASTSDAPYPSDNDPYKCAIVSDGRTTASWSSLRGWSKCESVEYAARALGGVTQRAATYIPIILTDASKCNPLASSHAYDPNVQEASVDGTLCYVVTFTDVEAGFPEHGASVTGSRTTTLWIDMNTFLLRRLVDDSLGTVTTPISPHAEEVQSHQEQVYSDEKINPSIPDNTFAMPTGV